MEYNERQKSTKIEFRKWAARTTIDGVPVMAASSTGNWGRVFFVIVITTVTVVFFVHLALLIHNFVMSGVYSRMMIEASVPSFPDVTICGLKPATESSLNYYESVVNYHLDYHWGYFDNWFAFERLQRQEETEVVYLERVRQIFQQMLEILWVTDNLRDLGLSAKSNIVECSFNKEKCDYRNFSLLQHYRYWNCYTFSQKQGTNTGDMEDGLSVGIFTDSHAFPSQYASSTSYRRTARNYHAKGHSLRQYLRGVPGEFPINSLLAGEYGSQGIIVVLHSTGTYPLNQQSFGHDIYVVQNGMSTTFRVETVNQQRLRRADFKCRMEAVEDVSYTATLGNAAGDNAIVRTYTRTAFENIVERLQSDVFARCGCHSHIFPFRVGRNALCFYVPHQLRKSPSAEVLSRIQCHRRWAAEANVKLAAGQQIKASDQPCNMLYREVQSDMIRWPDEEDMETSVNGYFARWLSSPDYQRDRTDSVVLNFSDSRIRGSVKQGQPILSPEAVGIDSLLENCSEPINFTPDKIYDAVKECLSRKRVLNNFLRVNVRLASMTTMVYLEAADYDLWELLSEIGGIMGLWFGISVMTLFELIEFACIIVSRHVSCRGADKTSLEKVSVPEEGIQLQQQQHSLPEKKRQSLHQEKRQEPKGNETTANNSWMPYFDLQILSDNNSDKMFIPLTPRN